MRPIEEVMIIRESGDLASGALLEFEPRDRREIMEKLLENSPSFIELRIEPDFVRKSLRGCSSGVEDTAAFERVLITALNEEIPDGAYKYLPRYLVELKGDRNSFVLLQDGRIHAVDTGDKAYGTKLLPGMSKDYEWWVDTILFVLDAFRKDCSEEF